MRFKIVMEQNFKSNSNLWMAELLGYYSFLSFSICKMFIQHITRLWLVIFHLEMNTKPPHFLLLNYAICIKSWSSRFYDITYYPSIISLVGIHAILDHHTIRSFKQFWNLLWSKHFADLLISKIDKNLIT